MESFFKYYYRESKRIIRGIDFKIGKHCLDDNHEQVYKLLQETYPKSFDAVAIREWPIFINFRETEFYNKFVSEHKEDFEIQLLVSEPSLQSEETGAEEVPKEDCKVS